MFEKKGLTMDINWGEVWGVVITTVVVGLIKYMYTFLKELRAKHDQEQRTKNNIIDALMKNSGELVEWRKDIEEKNQRIEQELQSINRQVQKITHSDLVIMKDRILQTCRYFLSKGYITLSARENITEMYHCYQDMGGNGTGKLVYEQAMNLPIKDNHIPDEVIIVETAEDGGTLNGRKSTRKRKAKVDQSNQGNVSIHQN